MKPIDWTLIISELMQAGTSQAAIAAGCGVAQSTISDLHRGRTRQPNFELGTKLVQLHERLPSAPTDAVVEVRDAA